MLALQQGEEQAFDRLLERHLDSIYRYLQRQLGNPADAEELSQETFTRLLTHGHTYNPEKAALTTWLHRIAYNLSVDRLRTSRTVNDDDIEQHAQPNEGHEAAVSPVQLEWLNGALSRLPTTQKSALALVYLQGFSNKEAADIMGIGLRALESLLARGKRALHSYAEGLPL